ncbi:MAG: MBL fold metallo-hydrolase [Candidatus Lokiarchaeota archaeon]|nr:MBL fold metallo-hydrolase [Candidatus Lokiarchaeota archaeon]
MKKIFKDVYFLGNSGCAVYLVDSRGQKDGLVLIDCGMSLDVIKNITKMNLDPKNIKHCILTHSHIDHIAACHELYNFNKKINFYAHELDAEPIEKKGYGDRTAASWYGVNYKPIKLEKRFKSEEEILQLGKYKFTILHTPGHTPGSIVVLLKVANTKILFGQDIHGPFYESFGSNLKDYQKSMDKLLKLEPDILCEGHFGIIEPVDKVKEYITRYKEMNKP